jgi:uncharacterized Zn-binding protein involved in type VI secretion
MRKVIRLGDPTTHGGAVVGAAANYTMDGVPVARMGDMCTCPIRGHSGCTIVEGDPAWLIGGLPVALEGHHTSCGAVLISTFGRLERSHEESRAADGGLPSAATQINASHRDTAMPLYDDRYVIHCAATGEALKQVEYAIRRADGSIEYGTTDEQGHTHLLSAVAQEEQIAIYIEG